MLESFDAAWSEEKSHTNEDTVVRNGDLFG